MLDIGVNDGAWSMHALEMGCQVIAIDKVPGNMHRVVQTMTKARDSHGRLMIESFHGFTNNGR